MIDITTGSRARSARDTTGEVELRELVCAEFREMPGMCLTVMQAARLFNAEASDCARVLSALVSDGTLRTNGQQFFQAGSGRRC